MIQHLISAQNGLNTGKIWIDNEIFKWIPDAALMLHDWRYHWHFSDFKQWKRLSWSEFVSFCAAHSITFLYLFSYASRKGENSCLTISSQLSVRFHSLFPIGLCRAFFCEMLLSSLHLRFEIISWHRDSWLKPLSVTNISLPCEDSKLPIKETSPFSQRELSCLVW